MYSIGTSGSGAPRAITIEEKPLADSVRSVSRPKGVENRTLTPRSTFGTTRRETHQVWYQGFFGRVDIRYKSTSLSRSNDRRFRNKAAVFEEEVVRISPILLRKIFELRFVTSLSRIPRTLNIYSIIDWRAPIFDICCSGDLQGLQAMLSSGTVSPFVSDDSGRSLLHVSLLLGW